MTINMTVETVEEFKEQLPTSGLFDIYDCSMRLECPEHLMVFEVEEITRFLNSCINVADIEIVATESSMIHITLKEVPIHIAERRRPRPTEKRKSNNDNNDINE
jgi:hypothetical protein